ncbi:unnamed protein product [Fraxinus pennsylvanica]|uniref:Uncharacterized protein n=1 Tax=Fraxinus pennsylvanica TaxID=56036 RepID=A0AAD1ZGG9_9LAMI|nr:unnamed protein product [Fraxinus pennsylvanica]
MSFCSNKHGRNGIDSVKELFRFSHSSPSFQMTRKEGPNVPKGSFELNRAFLPANLSEVVESEPTEAGKMYTTAASSKFFADVDPEVKFEKNAPKEKLKGKFLGNAVAASLVMMR